MKIEIKDAPGLSSRSRRGRTIVYWRATNPMIKAGFRPTEIEIKGFDPGNPADHPLIANEWRKLQSSAETWMTGKHIPSINNGTIRDLSRMYQTNRASPYKRIKPVTRRLYDGELRLIEATCGERIVGKIKAEEIVDWHATMRGETHVRKAQGFIKQLRSILKFGIVIEFPGAARLHAILSNMEFETPARRTSVLNYEMVTAIIDAAHKAGKSSIALAQAIQFETSLRQTDVIGQWTGDRWHSGLVWQQIDKTGILALDTSKTGASVTYDLLRMPLIKAELDRVQPDKKIGPLIIDERSGIPYKNTEFSKQWRKIANDAGIPKEIWNRDSRAGALSEGDEAGATLNDLQRIAGHTTSKMTGRYVRGQAVETSRKVSELRVARRSQNASGS